MNWHRTLPIAGAAACAGAAAVLLAGRLRRLEVTGPSMRPTLEEGDRVLVVRDGRARPGDLVVVPDPRNAGRLVVKRVVVASAGGLTVRGDNPSASTDSRDFGPVAASSVRGRVVYRYAPPVRRGGVHGRLRGRTPLVP
ncbi:MAG: nickel-type superoxide dismutase maturation protease [Acidimicrobiia bacterium]